MPTTDTSVLEQLDFSGLEDSDERRPVPAILSTLGVDTARTRRTDRVQSHMAGDRSQATVKPTKRAVLLLVIQHGELTGAALNDEYRAHRKDNNWGVIAFDTPRKRAEELEKDGYLAARYQTSEGNHLPEAVYSITDLGRSAVTA